MRRRERDEVATAARRRLKLLEAELAGLRGEQTAESGTDHRPGRVATTEPEAFFEEPRPLAAGPPAGLDVHREVLYAPRGRPLPAPPVPVRAPGRHAVPRRGSMPDWVEDRVPAPWNGRVALSGPHLTLLAGALAVVLLVSGWVTLHRGGDDPVPAARFVAGSTSAGPAAGGTATGSAGAASATPTAPGPSGPSATVVVDVGGKVGRPGVVTLPTGSRVQDAISRAGGIRPGVAAGSLNLARVLVDGEQILVGVPAAAGAAPAMAGATAAPEGGLVNLNSASLTQLEDLPGVGPVTAQKILEYRTAHGAFTSVDQLLEVDGIGDKTLADIAPHATL